MLLVTGVTGHSGKYFLQELIDHHYPEPIRCIVRETSDTKQLDTSGLDIDTMIGDLSDQEFVDKAMAGVDEIVHIASIFYSVNLIRAAVKNHVNRAILVHTTGIYSKFKSASRDYQAIEQSIQDTLRDSGTQLHLIYLRPTMIYGYTNDRNMVVFIKMLDKLRLFPLISGGKNLMQPVNGRDLGRAYYQVLTHPNILDGDYILSGDKPMTMRDMFDIISGKLGKKTTYISVPLGLGVAGATALKRVTLGRVDFVERVQRMGEDRSFSHSEAQRDFGYDPMPFDEGVGREVEEYRTAST